MKRFFEKLKNLRKNKMFLPVLLIGFGVLAIIMTFAFVDFPDFPEMGIIINLSLDDLLFQDNYLFDYEEITILNLYLSQSTEPVFLTVSEQQNGNGLRINFGSNAGNCQIDTTCSIKKLFITTGNYPDTVIISPTITTSLCKKAILNLGSGNDVFTAAGAAVQLEVHAGPGNDNCEGGAKGDLLEGDEGNDTLKGNEGRDKINGGNGNDILNGGRGDDQISGGSGQDTIDGGPGKDTCKGGWGNDTINGGDGDDIIDESDMSKNGGWDTMSGDAGNDIIKGGSGNDIINGGPGDDTIYGGTGNDVCDGGDGKDKLWGGNHNDILTGGPGAGDEIRGEFGSDQIIGGPDGEEDKLSGGAHQDFFFKDQYDTYLPYGFSIFEDVEINV